MILEIAIASGIAVLAGSFAAFRRKQKRTIPPPAENVRRALRVGDVLLYDHGEIWLAGSVQLDDGAFSLRLFRTPGNPHADWVATLDADAAEIFLLRNDEALARAGAGDEFRLRDTLYQRKRRGQAHTRLDGEELPSIAASVKFAFFEGVGGNRAIVLEWEPSTTLALLGTRAEPSRIDILPGGDARDATKTRT